MSDNSGVKRTKKTVKHWVAVFLFGAIIVVFALWGINPSQYGEASGGAAATVNDAMITLEEFRNRVEQKEQEFKIDYSQFPEAQRRQFSSEVRRRALDELIMGEVVYQAAKSRGIVVPDAEVRDYILQIPFLSENGRFLKERYRAFLSNQRMTSDEFERRVRKQLMGQKLQDLFVGAASPSAEELKRNRALTSQKVNLRFVELKNDDIGKPGFISDAEVAAYLAANKGPVEEYYKSNTIEFTNPEKVKAKHILIRVDDKRKDADAAKLAAEVQKQATPANFSALATKYSEDPGSKAKGGELGEFERGAMVPEFSDAAFSTPAGKVSQVVKSPFGYHIILVEKKTEGGTAPLAKVETEIARKLLARSKESEIMAKTKAVLEKGDRKEIDAMIAKSGLKWNETGDFDLTAAMIPKIGEGKEVVSAVMRKGKASGLVQSLVALRDGRHLIIDVTSWKEVAPKVGEEAEGASRMAAYRKSSDLIEAWAKDAESQSDIHRNPRVLQ